MAYAICQINRLTCSNEFDCVRFVVESTWNATHNADIVDVIDERVFTRSAAERVRAGPTVQHIATTTAFQRLSASS